MQDFQLDENSDIPLWSQLKKRLTYLIISGSYQTGDQLPTVRELSAQLCVAYNTVSKVYRDLERDGLIKTKQGKGTFVIYNGAERSDVPDAAVEGLALKLIEAAKDAGMNDDEIILLVRRHLERTGA